MIAESASHFLEAVAVSFLSMATRLHAVLPPECVHEGFLALLVEQATDHWAAIEAAGDHLADCLLSPADIWLKPRLEVER
mmetsp:Transcript_29685/g.54090  ORF Transcript_29685/g.54090 Transcript_29685/m.54090 type:complete len:80 (-) Transcript_29685:361-600(-)